MSVRDWKIWLAVTAIEIGPNQHLGFSARGREGNVAGAAEGPARHLKMRKADNYCDKAAWGTVVVRTLDNKTGLR
jgi:hypothetical protein